MDAAMRATVHPAARLGVLAILFFTGCSPHYLTADLAEKIIRTRCARQPNGYMLRTGYLRNSGNLSVCGEYLIKCPWYAELVEMGLIAIECRQGKPFAALTAKGHAHVDPYIGHDPLHPDTDLHWFRLADWHFIGVISVKQKNIVRGWTDDSIGADVVYRWEWAPTATGRLFMKKGWPRSRLMYYGASFSEPLAVPIEESVELQRYKGQLDWSWDLSMPKEKGRGGIYVQ